MMKTLLSRSITAGAYWRNGSIHIFTLLGWVPAEWLKVNQV